jgi:hypothetical protein
MRLHVSGRAKHKKNTVGRASCRVRVGDFADEAEMRNVGI